MYFKKNIYLLLMIMMLSLRSLHAEVLSNKAIFHRCYKQITQSFPSPTSELAQQVQQNQIDPIEACILVLNKANFTANNNKQISNINDQEASNVLRTFQSLHFSWFTNKILTSLNGDYKYLEDNVDVNGPSLSYTRALFTPNYQFKNIFRGSENIESKRLNGRPDIGPSSKEKREDYAVLNPILPFQEVGLLVGYNTYAQRDYVATRIEKDKEDTVTTLKTGVHWGGGVIGSNTYALLNIIQPRNYKSDGAIIVPRKWAQNVLHDFMCRELPVIRYDDSLSFISSNEEAVSFRKEGSCVRCHATMDRMAGVIRNIRPQDAYGTGAKGNRTFSYLDKWPESKTGNHTWSDIRDGDFYRRPAVGHFLYRTFDGKKIDRTLSSAENLGQVIGELEDPYVCAAKRYYQYFTGITVSIDDIKDPQYGKTLSAIELTHRNEVIALGKSFKQHQNMKKLIEDILKKPQFKDSAYQKE